MLRLSAFLAVGVLLACSSRPGDSGVNPVDGRPEERPATGQPGLEFGSRPHEGGTVGRVEAEGGAGAITVRGSQGTPNPCYTLAASVRRDGSALTLTVQAASTGGVCIQVVGAFAYDAAVRGLAPGRYDLRVVHTYPGTGWETRTALETTVTVR